MGIWNWILDQVGFGKDTPEKAASIKRKADKMEREAVNKKLVADAMEAKARAKKKLDKEKQRVAAAKAAGGGGSGMGDIIGDISDLDKLI